VKNSLQNADIPDNVIILSCDSSFATSSATVTLDSSIVIDAALIEEFVDAVECVGFDCEFISKDEYEDLVRVSKQKKENAKVVSKNENDLLEDLELGECDGEHTFHCILSVSGMSCAVCVGRVENILLNAADNVIKATVVLATGRAKVVFNRSLAGDKVLRNKRGDINNYQPLSNLLDTSDKNLMDFSAQKCAEAVTKEGYECHVMKVMDSTSASNGVSLQENALQMEQHREAELLQWKHLFLFGCAFTIPLVAIHLGAFQQRIQLTDVAKDFVMCLLATPVQFYVGKRFYIAAYKSLVNGGVMGMDFLVSMGTSAAYFYSLIVLVSKLFCGDCNGNRPATFETAAMLLTFVTFGKYLEAYAKGRTASALQTLMELQPTVACRVLFDNNTKLSDEILADVNFHALSSEDVSINDVKVGDILLVLPGARIPSDGVMVAREGKGDYCYIDESALSGEPFPVAKGIGDKVYGSCVNQLSPMLVRVTATGGETFLARIVQLIEDAQANRAPIQALADKVAGKFAPFVMMLSAITFVSWAMVGFGNDTYTSLYSALMSAISVIVIACPCALGLATPTAVMVGTGVGAKLGLLIKGGGVLEKASTVRTVIFDKTGTLTTGRAILGEKQCFVSEDDKVMNYCPSDVSRENFALWLAACAESCSEHPLGKAIYNGATNMWGSDPLRCKSHGVVVSDFYVEPGSGVECSVRINGWIGERKVRVGTKLWTSDANCTVGVTEATAMRQRGQIVVFVSITGEEMTKHVVGILGIVDPVKEDAKNAVSALQSMGVDVWMCTGDHHLTAYAVASEVGIIPTNICANVKPEGKADLVRRLQKRKSLDQKGHGVAMIGDGINDSVALAVADVGMAIGAGTEIAVDAADIVLVRSSLHDVVVALHLSKTVFRRIQINFIWATAYNFCALPIAMGVLYPFTSWRLPPAFAGLMMAFSSVSVVTSSLLLNMYKKPEHFVDRESDRSSARSKKIKHIPSPVFDEHLDMNSIV